MMKVDFRWNIWNLAACNCTCGGSFWQDLSWAGAISLCRKHTSESIQKEWERKRQSWMNMLPRIYRRFFGHWLKTGCHFSLGFNLHDLLHVQCLPVFVRHSIKTKNRQDADLGNGGYTALWQKNKTENMPVEIVFPLGSNPVRVQLIF